MRASLPAFASLAILLSGQAAATAIYGQCGGIGFTGDTTCASGSVCTYENDWYYQCLPPSSSATTVGSTTTTSKSTTSTTSTSTSKSTTSTSTTSTTKSTTSTSTTSTTKSSSTGTTTSTAPAAGTTTNSAGCSGSLTKFKYFGVNQSGAEFGSGNIPGVQAISYQGVLGTDYTWPSPSSIDYFVADGFNTFRVTFLMERLSPPANGLTGAFDSTQIVNYITNKGAYAVIDPHNFMRYNGNIITSSSDFSTWWTNLAAQFKSNSRVIFDLQNEPYGIDATTVYSMMQAAVLVVHKSPLQYFQSIEPPSGAAIPSILPQALLPFV
ncbi:hypothetical protein H0H93_000973 [Arthromyces matolae]|nr:hypothetical protein H0H93_000973 [Arthromyces matolae]